jgi:hypothetical protein
MPVMLRSPQMTLIKFADAFAHSPVSVTGRVKNVSHVLIEAFVTQRPTSHRYACGLAASAGDADAALRFPQTIDPAHCLVLVGEPVKREVMPERGVLSPAFGFQVASAGWPPHFTLQEAATP